MTWGFGVQVDFRLVKLHISKLTLNTMIITSLNVLLTFGLVTGSTELLGLRPLLPVS